MEASSAAWEHRLPQGVSEPKTVWRAKQPTAHSDKSAYGLLEQPPVIDSPTMMAYWKCVVMYSKKVYLPRRNVVCSEGKEERKKK